MGPHNTQNPNSHPAFKALTQPGHSALSVPASFSPPGMLHALVSLAFHGSSSLARSLPPRDLCVRSSLCLECSSQHLSSVANVLGVRPHAVCSDRPFTTFTPSILVLLQPSSLPGTFAVCLGAHLPALLGPAVHLEQGLSRTRSPCSNGHGEINKDMQDVVSRLQKCSRRCCTLQPLPPPALEDESRVRPRREAIVVASRGLEHGGDGCGVRWDISAPGC